MIEEIVSPRSHSDVSTLVRNVILGMSDGLTVPFAIAAGLAGAHASTTTIITTAMLAEIAAGSISMGLGGYLATQTEADHYTAERARKKREVTTNPNTGTQGVIKWLMSYGLSSEESMTVTALLKRRRDAWFDFMMRFELGEEPNKNRALKSAVTIGGFYIIGGLIPLIPYLVVSSVPKALYFSIILTGSALLIFGFLRGHFIGGKPWKGMLQTLLVGGLAAGAAFLLAKIVS